MENRLNGPGISMVARLSATITPTLVNELVASYVDSHITLKPLKRPGRKPAAPLCPETISNGIGYIFNNGFGGNKLPGLVVAGTNAAYGGLGFAVDTSYMPWDHTNPTYSLGDSLSKAIGGSHAAVRHPGRGFARGETNGAIGSATGDLQGHAYALPT